LGLHPWENPPFYYAISPSIHGIPDHGRYRLGGIKDDDSWVGEKKNLPRPFSGFFFFFSENSLTRIDDMRGPPQRGNHKEAGGEWGKGVT
jgi:hypothetical protein